MRIALLIVLGGLSAGCNATSNRNWIEVENYGESALYLDLASVTGNGQLRTFDTKLATPGWMGIFSKNEILNTYQIDCKAKTLRNVKGGFGRIGPRGYGKLLYERVC